MPDDNGFISASHVPVDSLHENVSQVVIVTTEDRLRNILNDYERTLDNKKPWIAVMSVFLTLVTTLVTSEPTNLLSCEKSRRAHHRPTTGERIPDASRRRVPGHRGCAAGSAP